MNWNECYGRQEQPTIKQIETYIGNSLFSELCSYIETTYRSVASIEHSICSMQPGWNVKYKKSSRAVCTIYPEEGYFICMISVGSKAAPEAELILNGCTQYVQSLYYKCKPFNGGRWLMIEVTDVHILEDIKELIAVKIKHK